MDDKDSTDSQLQIQLFTKQVQYAVDDTLYCVPTNITTEGLNDLLKKLLEGQSRTFPKQKFDFLINDDEILRDKLGEHLTSRKIPTEHDVRVEYIEATPAPEALNCLKHDDWVSAVHATNKWILSGCYDNSLHIRSAKKKHLATMSSDSPPIIKMSAHSGPIKGVSWLDDQSPLATFVSVAQDQTALLWGWDVESNKAHPLYVCRGHERSVNAVDVRPSESLFVTGGWDCTLKIWSADTSVSVNDTEEESSSKRRKGENGPYTRIPKSTIKGHREAVSSVQWIADDEILSASWDHTLKIWDAEYGGIKHEVTANKSIFNAHYSEKNRQVVTCGADRHVRLYDPRSNDGNILKKTYTNHTQWVTAVKWSTTDENIFVSCSYDAVLKLWDRRCCNASLWDLPGNEDKILCCDWSNPDLIISGGCDCTLRLYNAKK